MNLLLSALAAFYLWTLLRFFAPVVIPDRLALILFAGISYGTVMSPWTLARTVLAVAGAAVLLIRAFALMGDDAPEPWDWRAYRPRLPARRSMTGLGHVPGEAPSKVGRRMPRL
jgi:hypothetical protein